MENLDRILGRNETLPEPNAIKAARSAWTREERHVAAAAEGALR